MQHFIFVDDVESGEMGYALSTFEAVLTYLVSESAPLRKASARNKRLWQATKTGNIREMRSILEPDGDYEASIDDSVDNEGLYGATRRTKPRRPFFRPASTGSCVSISDMDKWLWF